MGGLSEAEQEDIDAKVRLLEQRGPALGRPHVDSVKGSKHSNMKELIVQHAGRPYRVLFAFDPRRCAVLLIGGDKTGNKRWWNTCRSLTGYMTSTLRRCSARSARGGRASDGKAV